MGDDRNEPTELTPQGFEVPVPKRADFLRNLTKTARPRRDGPQEIEDAARDELEIPADETDEG